MNPRNLAIALVVAVGIASHKHRTHVFGNVLRLWQPNRTPCSDGFAQQAGPARRSC